MLAGTFNEDNLLAAGSSQANIITENGTILTGQGALARGSVLGIVTASGKFKLCASGSSDGSQVAKAVLAESVDTTGADVPAVVYRAGAFNEGRLIFGGSDTVAQHKEELIAQSIYPKPATNVAGQVV